MKPLETGASAGAGQPAPLVALIDVAKLVTAYFSDQPDPGLPAQRVVFGTSGHRGSAFDRAFNEWHVLAMAQAVCDHRRAQGINGPLFLGVDTHALSEPASATVLEVMAANGVDLMLAPNGQPTPTPAVSLAILAANRQRGGQGAGLADGIILTPSHNPPRDGGFKYNPPHGGPAGQALTADIETRANRYLQAKLEGVRRMSRTQALSAGTTHRYDYCAAYVAALGEVLNLPLIRSAGVRMGVDPLGGAGVHYWAAIAEHHGLDLQAVSTEVDPTFRFMPLDRDGLIRMDPSSPYAMQRLIALRGNYDIGFACDTDHDRHGIVTRAGLMPSNHYLAVAVDYLFRQRPEWPAQAAVGKTMVSSQLIDRVTARLNRPLFEVPVGFKWFAAGLQNGNLGFGGEESAGASFLRRDGTAWTTDKDGMAAALLSAEIMARSGRDPDAWYAKLTQALGNPQTAVITAAATRQHKQAVAALSAQQVTAQELAGEAVLRVETHAPGNRAPLDGIKVSTANGWFAARPSGTEDLIKIYAESFLGDDHLQRLLQEAQSLVAGALG